MSTTPVLPVSVVICVRNRADELGRCLNSLAHVSVQEVIVVDGCSTDGTVAVAQAWGARVISDEGLGLGHARRIGVLKATQPYVMFLDSDVLLPGPDVIQALLDELIAKGYAGIHPMLRGDDSQTIWERAQDAHWNLTFNKPGPRKWIGCVATIFDREILLDCLPDPSVSGAEDGDLSHRIIQRGGRLGVANEWVIHAHRSSFPDLWKQRVWYGRGNARRAWKDRSLSYLAGPVVTATYLTWQAATHKQFLLIPYSAVHATAGLLGELSEVLLIMKQRISSRTYL